MVCALGMGGVTAATREAEKAAARAACLETVAAFPCSSCREVFYGGRADCASDEALDLASLKCPPCTFLAANDHKCRTHGFKFAVYKCDSCCAVATFDCRSNHYCSRCHEIPYERKSFKCPAEASGEQCGGGGGGDGVCPLGIPHPANVEAVHGNVCEGFVIGCVKCFELGSITTAAEEEEEEGGADGDEDGAALARLFCDKAAAVAAAVAAASKADVKGWSDVVENHWEARF